MKKILLFLSLCAFLHGSVTVQGITFNDYEQNASNFLLHRYPLQTFNDLGFSSLSSSIVFNCRDLGTPTIECVSNSGLTVSDLLRLRDQSYLIDWSVVTNSLGINQRDYNSLMALFGVLVGFLFAFGLIYAVLNISRHRG